MSIEWVVDKPGVKLGIGNATDCEEGADLVFTHPYAPLPSHLLGKPAIINTYGFKNPQVSKWVGAHIMKVSKWSTNNMNCIYVANHEPVPSINLTGIIEVPPGWFPEELVSRMLDFFPNATSVWDGFMGRGTVGKVALARGMSFVGVDKNPDRVKLAREYLGV